MNYPDDRLAWFRHARFGLFVHWGLYSARGRGEWAMSRECIPWADYHPLLEQFTADRYDPKAWAAMARDAGMRYAVLTSKHHEGFCLWDSKRCDFNATASAAKRDVFAEYVDAFRDAGLKVGAYYSLGDWLNPDWIAGSHGDEQAERRFVQYTHELVHELVDGYDLDVLWYDLPQNYTADQWRSVELNASVRAKRPNILINNRAMTTEDFATPEQHAKPSDPGRLWEACMTLNDNWGYYPSDRNYKSPRQVVSLLASIAESAGNLLLNVGPDRHGQVTPEACDVLAQVGRWMDTHGPAIHDSQRHAMSWNLWGPCTARGHTLYLHLLRYPDDGRLIIGTLNNTIRSATLLTTGQTLDVQRLDERRWAIDGLPPSSPDPLLPVVQLELDGPPQQDFGWQLKAADLFPVYPV